MQQLSATGQGKVLAGYCQNDPEDLTYKSTIGATNTQLDKAGVCMLRSKREQPFGIEVD